MSDSPSAADRGNALAYVNVRLYLTGQGLSNIGTFFQIVALSLLVLDLTGKGFALGTTMALGALPFLLLSPWAGVMIDRLPVRQLLICTGTLAGLQALTIGLLVSTGHISIGWLLALTLLLGVVQAFDRPASQAFISELVPRTHLPSAIALASAAQSVGRLGGPAVAALMYASLGAAWCFYVNAASYAMVVIALLLLRRSQLLPRARGRQADMGLRAGFRFAWRSPVHRTVLLAHALIGCLAFNFPLFYSSITKVSFHAGSMAFGIAESLNAITAVLGGLLLTRVHFIPTRRRYVLGCGLLGLSLAWSALSPALWIFYASMLYFGAAVVFYSTASQSLIQYSTPPAYVGRMMSLFMLGTMGTTPVGGLISGWLIDAVSPRAAIGAGAIALFVCGAAVLLVSGTTLSAPAQIATLPEMAEPAAVGEGKRVTGSS